MLAGTLASSKKYLDGTVPSSKNYLDGTVPSSKKLVAGTSKKGREGVGGSKRGNGRGNFPLAYIGSRAGGDNRKRAHSAQRRDGPKAGSPTPCTPVWASFP